MNALTRSLKRFALAMRTAVLAVVLVCGAVGARAATLVHDFYLPMPEAQIRQKFVTLETNVSTTLDSVFSVVVTGPGTVIYYDQWEDGYETDLANPVQPSTQVWGDGNNANGIPPGFVNDPVGLPSGAVLALRNFVTLPRNPSQLLFDARDRMAATKALVVSRAAWATTPGPVLSGAVEVQATIDYGTSYISPVGQNLTNRLFQYVGFMIMAEQDNTSVAIDLDGAGTNFTALTVILNRGESHLVNGGVRTGGSVIATKPVQVNLVIGKYAGRYATDWFTLAPTNDWGSSYITPVGTAANGNQTFNYFYNPNATNITINFLTRVGSGSFNVPAGGVTQYQMPQNSGARFTSLNGAKFFAVCTAGANPASESAYDWGFTLLPFDGLTTEAVVGWGPGSSDGTVNGSPAWVTPVAATRVYVDYNGDRNGPLTDPNGNKYDVHYDLAALESKTVYDPDKDQTAMRLYTVDGTVISAAWGEDPAVAGAGNPYLDFGTTVLPFPVPVLRKSFTIVNDAGTPGLSVGDRLEYTIELDNRGLLPLGNTVVIDALPTNMLAYVTNSTTYNGSPLADSLTGTRFPLDETGYTIPVILRGGTSQFKFQVTTLAPGNITNVVSAVGYSLVASAVATPPPGGGSTQCGLNFANAAGTTVVSYPAGTNIFVRLTDADANSASNSVQTVSVAVKNLTSADLETINLTETGNNTGIFQNTSPLPSSVAGGLFQQDGTLNAQPGDALQVNYTDPVYADACAGNAVIQVPALTKVLYLTGTNSPDQGLDRIDPVATGDNTTAQSIAIGGGTPSVVTVDAVTSRTSTTQVTTFAHTTGSGTNRLLLVSASYDRGGGTISSVTYNGVNLVNAVNVDNTSGSVKPRVDIWQLVNPPSGTFNVQVTFSGASGIDAAIGAVTFNGVDQTTPTSGGSTNLGNSTSASVTVPSATGELVYDTMALASSAATTAGGSQTTQWSTNTSSIRGSASTKAGAVSTAMSWTHSSARWAAAGVSIRPAAVGGGGTNFVTFTQAPNFCANFSLPSNSVVSITNYVTVTNGSLAASPAVTATLRYGATTFAQLTNAAYNSASNWIVWSGTLSSNVTVPAGQAVALTISNNTAATFRIDYDSAAKPSKIALPATTVINVDTFAVYDAPYPGGSVVTAPTAGSLLYVRAIVSDPFGAYDITSLGLNIDGPGVADDIATTLTNTVASDSCSKTYEFVWQTGANPGGFNLAATANEGTEGITDTANTSLTLTFLDLGTPSTTTFTSGNNGSATNAFPANSSICVRVNDSDQNTNATTADFISATITSGSGDSETLLLTETGTNSGVFTACIPSSTSGGAGNNSGTLNAPAGTVLNVTYTDPNDPSDVSSASGTVLTPPGVPGIAVSKTLVTPADGQAGVGENLQFNILVVNSGSTTLTNVSVTDNFPAANMTFVSASLAPSTVAPGTLTWTNLGTFTPGQSVTISVNFTASAVTASALNTAVATGTGATNSSGASVSITRSALTITKSLLNPTNGPVPIGSNITYRITVLNSGTVAIPTLPLEDTFSAAQLQFVSATAPPDGAGAGSLLWNDITGAGSLTASNTITIDVTMKVVGAGEPTVNTAKADYAVDANGDPVPSASGNVGIVTGAARITGNVYNDADQSGTLTGGDTGLPGVTLELYTDPNADGDPADGTLLRLVTTGAAGDYELLNLTTGRFVVVETDLPGFASSFPANNRLALNITGLTTNAGANFFDFIPAVTNYATVSGAVWSDTNNNGVLNLGEPGLANVSIELIQDVNTNGVADLGEPTVDSATTDVNGGYTFYSVVPGNYVVKETDLFGYVSTADSQGANDNQIALALGNGAVSTNNFFLDWFTGNNPGNDAPVAVNDSYSVNEDTLLTVPVSGVLTNDTDIDGDTLAAVLVATTTNGVLNLNANGSFTYLPNTNFFGGDTFTYRASDGTTNSGLATVTITVNAVNDAPLANNQNVTTPEDTSTNLVLTASDVDNTNLVFAILVGPTNGTLGTLNTNTGAVTYSPALNYNGPDFFTFTVFDGSLYATGTVSITVTPVNDPPIAVNDNATVNEDSTNSIPVLVNDSDSDGNPLTIVSVTSTNGAATINGTNVVYTPAPNFSGTNVITYCISDGFVTNCALITVIILPVNDAPVAVNDSYSVNEDTLLTVAVSGVLTNDTDVEGSALTAVLVATTTNGVLNLNANGSFTYLPNTNFFGTDTFTYRANDGSTNSGIATVTISVLSVNDAPVATNLSVTIPEDTSTNLVVRGSDIETTNLIYAILVGPTNGTLGTLNTNTGAVTYSPATNYNGPDFFTFTVFDGSLYATGSVSITVTPLNDAPVAVNDSYSVNEDTLLTVAASGVLTNDTDVEGSALTAVLVATTTNGVLNLNANGSFTYLPGTNFFGTDTFTYRANDGSSNSGIATVTITVNAVNDAPVANNDSYSTLKNVTLNVTGTGVLTNDTDVEGSALTAALVANVTHGVLSLNANGSFTYTPSNNYVGPDSFTYRANDGLSNSAIAAVTLNVVNTNTAPVAINDSYSVNEDTLLTVPVSGVLTNDTDIDGDTLTAVLVATTTNGVLNLNANGSFTYLPNTNFFGGDSFTYRANDGTTNSGLATVTITVNAVNDAPVATNLSVTIPEDTSTNLVVRGSDIETTNLIYAILTNPTNGTLGTLNTNTGAVTYSPNTNFNGADGFTFTVFDGSLYATGTVSITVTPVNDPPVAVNDNATVNEDSTNSIPVLVNDSDPDGNPLTLVSVNSTNGTATINGTNVTYIPSPDFSGTNVITYCISDGFATNCASIFVNVLPVNDAPVANNLVVTIPEDTATNLVLTASDVDSTNLTFSIVTGPASGVLGVLNTNTGSVTYTPNLNYVGGDSFTFRVFDGALYATGTVSITVTPINDAPQAFSQSVTNLEDTPLPITLTGSDVDGPVTNFVLVSLPLHGALTGSGANLTYTPTNNYFGPDSLTFTVNDGSLTSAVATVSITVLPVNDAPVANNDAYSTFKNVTLNVAASGVLTNDTDVEGSALTAALVANVTHGVLSLNANGSFTYAPSNNYVGPDSFTYRASDGTTNSGIATVSINVVNTNTAPVAVNDSYSVNEDTLLTIPVSGVLTNDTDADLDSLTATLVATTTNGVLNLNANGSFTYLPNTNFFGADSFTYRASDGLTNSGIATVTITVNSVNDTPVATNLVVTTPEDTSTNLVLKGSDLETTNLVFAILVGPTNGALSVLNTNTGAVTYSPALNYNGPDFFTFTVFDGGLYATGTVSITVTPVNDPPIAVNDFATTPEDTQVSIPFLLNDSDPDGNPLSVQLVVFTNGIVTVSGTNLLYTPATNFFGTNIITYTISDGITNASAQVFVNVTPVNDRPVANNQVVTTPEDTSTNLVLTASDVDNTNLTFSIVTGPTNGVLGVLNTNSGAVTYTPNLNYNGPDGLTFRVFDGALYATGTVSITVTPVNDPPVAVNDNATVNEDSTNSIPVLVNDTDPDGNPLSIVSVISTNGTVSVSGTNVIYTPSPNFFGTNLITYCISDGFVTNCASVFVNVLPVNDAPVANNQNLITWEDAATNSVLTGADVDGNPIVFILVGAPTNGVLFVNTNTGGFSYTPNLNFHGNDSFTFRASDGSLTSAVATVSITVLPVNDAPVAFPNSYTVGQNLPLNVAAAGVLTNDTDVENDALTAVLVGNPANGTLTLNANGSFAYTPTNDFTGADSFTYRASDGQTNSAATTVTITVFPLADVVVLKTGPTNVNPGQNFTYTITVTNFGPSAASNVVVLDSMPTNLVFVSASAGGVFSNSVITWPTLGVLPKNGRTNFSLTVTAPTNGTFLNIASASASTADPNPANNDGSASASRVGSAVVAVQFGVRAGPNVFNPQTGLYEQTVIVTNTSASTVAALRVLAGDFASTNGTPRTNVWLWNASGTNFDGRRFVQYNSPLDPGQFVTLRLEYYNPTRVAFTNSLEVQATLPATSTNLTGGVVIDRAFVDGRETGNPRFVIEWTSVIGGRYTVIYSDNASTNWVPATPSVTATATRVQWYDDGPPKTASKPLTVTNRFYRVIVNP